MAESLLESIELTVGFGFSISKRVPLTHRPYGAAGPFRLSRS